MATFEQRVQELRDFERSEGIALPMFPADIVAWEDRGYTVDLLTGAVYSAVTAQPTPSAVAVLHLLAGVSGEFFTTS